MKYLFLIITLFLVGCLSLKSPNNDNNKNFENINDSTIVDENYFQIEDSIGGFGTGGAPDRILLQTERTQRDKVVIKEVIKNNNYKSSVNTQTDLGQVIYKVPDTMRVMKSYDVIIRISKSSTNIEISENLNGKLISKNIKTSDNMQVELIDPTGECFKISEINSKKQLVDSSYTEWIFNVMPLRSGKNKLNLVISIFKKDDVKQKVYSDEIYVQSNAPAQIKTFWYDNWKWSIETLIIPIITWLFGIWWGKRSEKKKRKN
jgi:hypothetical protein